MRRSPSSSTTATAPSPRRCITESPHIPSRSTPPISTATATSISPPRITTTITNVSVLLNNGDGTFASPVNYAVGTHPPSVFTADLDGDGDRDLVTANYDSDNVSVLLNNGNGTFAAAVQYSAGSGPWSAFPADLDGDNDVDLAVANYDNAKVAILSSDLNDVVAFQLTDPGDMTAGTRLAYAVSRVDQDGDPVTTGSDTVSLYTDSSGSGPHFYDAASGGSAITSRTIGPGASSAAFWYADETAGDWTVTVSDNAAAPDGAVGIDDDVDAVMVSSPPAPEPPPQPRVTEPEGSAPTEIEAYYLEGGCSPDATATLHIHAHSAAWYRVGPTSDLENLPWLNFDGVMADTDVEFPAEDGNYSTYFQFRSPSYDVSPVQSESIRVDLTNNCAAPPHEHELREGRIVAPELDEACIADFAHAAVLPYLVFPDGRALKPGSAAVRVESVSASETSYAFDADGDGQFEDVIVHIEHFESKAYAHIPSATSTAAYALRAVVFAGDLAVDDLPLWTDVSGAVGEEWSFDLDAYPEICSVEKVYHPHPGDLVRGQSGQVAYIGTDFKRHTFPEPSVLVSWFGDAPQIRTWPNYHLARFPVGQNVTIRPGRAVQVRTTLEYHLVAQQRTLRRVISEGVLQALFGPTWAQTSVWLVNTIFFGDYVIGQNVADVATVEPVPSETTIDEELGLPSPGELIDEHSAFPSGGAP
ncbi:VCBS repeat-containing protein [Patescibacteria group bacterium]|nr:MAG: VCBS repeat-containing protein [Patescibacteria group bacterium]